MNKDQFLQLVKNISAQKLVSREELIAAYDSATAIPKPTGLNKHVGISEILYYLGGTIVFIGVSILIWQNWNTLNSLTKILTTLGIGFTSYLIGVVFSRDEKLDAVGQAFFLISALVIPIGLYVVFDLGQLNVVDNATQSVISGILFATYIASYFIFRRTIFIIFSIIYGTWLFFSLTNLVMGSSPEVIEFKLNEYRSLLVGLSYILLGYYFSATDKAPLTGVLYVFGLLGFLGAGIVLGGWTPNQNVIWELIYPGIVFGVIFLSVYLKSREFLALGTIFLMIYLLKITAEYFSKGLGWPLALMISGFLLIGVGYLGFYLNKKYFKSTILQGSA